jgi:hypothetical protein
VTVSLGLIAGFSLLSQMHFWTVMTPAFSAGASGVGYITDQPNSVEATRRMAALKEARKVAAQCGIADDQSSKHILVDHVTYFALSHSYSKE